MTDRDRILTTTESDTLPDEQVSIDDTSNDEGAVAGAVGGAAAGAIAGTIVGGPVGAAAGAIAGAIGGAVVGHAEDEAGNDGDTRDLAGGAPADTLPGGVTAGPMSAAMGGGPGAIGVGGLGLPTAASDAEIEREGIERGPYDHPASYDETAAEVAKERSIQVGEDPGYEGVDLPAETSTPEGRMVRRIAPAQDYIRDRDDIAQGG